MKKRVIALLLVMILCSAAMAWAEAALPADSLDDVRLAGILITREDISVYTDETGILPASCVRNDPDCDPEYVFDQVAGLRLICLFMPDEAGEGTCLVSNVDDGISAVHFDVNEDGSSITMDATIQVVPGQEDALFFYNPVMRSASGQVFAVPGDFMAVSAAMNPYGSAVGQTVKDERTHTEDGREITDITTVTVQINAAREPAQIRLLQFSETHELLQSDAFAPGAVPDQIIPQADADYLLLETVEKAWDGTSFTRREVIGRDVDFLNTLSCRDDGICLSHYHDVLW